MYNQNHPFGGILIFKLIKNEDSKLVSLYGTSQMDPRRSREAKAT